MASLTVEQQQFLVQKPSCQRRGMATSMLGIGASGIQNSPKSLPNLSLMVVPSGSWNADAKYLLNPPTKSMTGQGSVLPACRVNNAWPCEWLHNHLAHRCSSSTTGLLPSVHHECET